MRIFTNEALYRRNSRLALITNLAGMFMLVGSVFILFNSNRFTQYLLLLFGGIMLVQIGAYFNRWNRRPDLALNKALAGLGEQYSLYHFRSPVPHLLIGPSGVWILLPRYTRGTITFGGKRWRAKSGLLARLGSEGIGNPVQEASLEAEAFDRYLHKHWSGGDLRVQAALVFVDEQTDVQVSGAPLPTSPIKRVKQVVLKGDPKGKLDPETINLLNKLLDGYRR
ncbi:MAG: hypothetical protein ACRDFQ_07845 [Anaerolineales bacterium]